MKIKSDILSQLAAAVVVVAAGAGHTAQAASVSLYGIGKVQNFVQSTDSTVSPSPDNAFAFRAFAVPTDANSLLLAFVYPPGGTFSIPVVLDQGDPAWTAEQDFASQAELDSSFPVGTYTNSFFNLTGETEGPTLILAAGTFPNAPQIANFSATQSVDPTKDLALNWNAFGDAGANDYEQLIVTDESGDVVFQTGLPGQANSLSGSAQSVNIPANTLQSGANTAALAFTKVATRDTTALSGAVGEITYSSVTSFTIQVGGGGNTGGGDTVAPHLVSVSPANLANNVPTNSPVIFTFSEPMASSQSIMWSFPGFAAGNFQYTWSADKTTLTCTYAGGFPGTGGVITWALDTTAFKDLAGNELAQTANIGGIFFTSVGQTGGGSNTNCNTSSQADLGAISVFKVVNYTQSSSAAPTLETNNAAFFSANVTSPTNNPVTQATLTLPGGTTRTLTNLFGQSFVTFQQFDSQEAMDAAFPAGNYTVKITRANGTATASLTLPANSYPPTPQISNFDVLQSFNATADQTVQWGPFTGVTASDFLMFTSEDNVGHEFNAPDECIPRKLANTATSLLIPKNTFASGSPIQGSLTFEKVSTLDTNSVAGFTIFSGTSKATRFEPKSTTGGDIVLQNFARQADGSVHFQVKATVGLSLSVESSSDLATWSPVTVGPAVGGLLDVIDTPGTGQSRRFYRAKTP